MVAQQPRGNEMKRRFIETSAFVSRVVKEAKTFEAATISVGERFQKIKPIKANIYDITTPIPELYERLNNAIDLVDYNSPNFKTYNKGMDEFKDRRINVVDGFILLHTRLYGHILEAKKSQHFLANLNQIDDATDSALGFALQQYNFFLMEYFDEDEKFKNKKAQAILAACRECNRPKLYKALSSYITL